MNDFLDTLTALLITTVLTIGTGTGVFKTYQFIKTECLQQISKGLSSSEELANALTGESL